MVIRSVVSDILGGWWYPPSPQMLLHCQKEQMLLTVNKHGPTSPRVTADVLNSEVKHDTCRESYHINNPNQTTISSEGTLSSARWMLDHRIFVRASTGIVP